jgi:hypothetical protein
MTRHLLSATAVAMALLMPHRSMSGAKPSSSVVDLGHLGGGGGGRGWGGSGQLHAVAWRLP